MCVYIYRGKYLVPLACIFLYGRQHNRRLISLAHGVIFADTDSGVCYFSLPRSILYVYFLLQGMKLIVPS